MSYEKQIKATLVNIATMHGRELNEGAIKMFVQALSDLDQAQVLSTLQDWISTSHKFPFPSDIRDKIVPLVSDRDNATYSANTIIVAVGKFGLTNPSEAKMFMGSLCWEVVNRFGGWKHICESLCFDNEGMYRAQLRDLADIITKKDKRGELRKNQELVSVSSDIKQLINKTMKSIG